LRKYVCTIAPTILRNDQNLRIEAVAREQAASARPSQPRVSGMLALLAVAGCASAGPAPGSAASAAATTSSPPPSWAAALGPDVEVVGPLTGAPAADTPAAAVLGYIHQLAAPNPAGACLYMTPANQANCQSGMAQDQTGYASYSSLGIGYTAIYGDLALVVTTHAHLCVAKSCIPDNSNPAVDLDSGKSFVTLFGEAVNPNTDPPGLIPCIRGDGGIWYLDFSE